MPESPREVRQVTLDIWLFTQFWISMKKMEKKVKVETNISSLRQIKTTEAARNKVPPSTRSTTKKVVLNMKAIADESRKMFLAPNLFIMWPRTKVAKIWGACFSHKIDCKFT